MADHPITQMGSAAMSAVDHAIYMRHIDSLNLIEFPSKVVIRGMDECSRTISPISQGSPPSMWCVPAANREC